MSDIPTPIIGLVIAVFVLVFLVVRTRVHALIAMLAAACIAGITGGMSIDKTLTVITQGFGSTLGSIGIVIGLGVMMGRLLEVSGAAEQIAYSFIKWLGKRREECQGQGNAGGHASALQKGGRSLARSMFRGHGGHRVSRTLHRIRTRGR